MKLHGSSKRDMLFSANYESRKAFLCAVYHVNRRKRLSAFSFDAGPMFYICIHVMMHAITAYTYIHTRAMKYVYKYLTIACLITRLQ